MSARFHVRPFVLCLALALSLLGAACSTTREDYWRGDLGALDITAASPAVEGGAPGDAVASAFARAPAARLPVRIAVARLESREVAPGWRHKTNQAGSTNHLVLAAKADAVTSAAYQRLAALPEVSDLTPLNSLVAAKKIDSQEALREAAANVQADLVHAYTFDSYSRSHTALSGIVMLSLGLLGFLPLVSIEVETTVSGALIDVRSGYIYGVADATEKVKGASNTWNESDDIDRVRAKAETAAFEKLNAEFEQRWQSYVNGMRARPRAAGARGARAPCASSPSARVRPALVRAPRTARPSPGRARARARGSPRAPRE